MTPRSSIDDIKPDIRKKLDQMIASGTLSLDDLYSWTKKQGCQVSRSALGRRRKRLERMQARLRRGREITQALALELGEAALQGRQGRLLVEAVRTMVMEFLVKEEEGEGLQPKDMVALGRCLKDLSQSLRMDREFEQRVREQEQAQVKGRLDKAVQGRVLDAQRAEEVRRILGFGT